MRLHNPSVVLELDPDGTFDEDGTPFYRRAIMPDAVADAFGVGDTLVEIIDGTPTNARHEEGNWHSRATMPAVHVQVRLSAM